MSKLIKKYPFLNSPDFAFENDLNERINYFNSKIAI